MSFKILAYPFRQRLDIIRNIARKNAGKKLHRGDMLALFGYSRHSVIKQSRMYQMGIITEYKGEYKINKVKDFEERIKEI
jgi:hypothetical protein